MYHIISGISSTISASARKKINEEEKEGIRRKWRAASRRKLK